MLPNGKHKNQIDYIILRRKDRKKVRNSEILSKPDLSDHILLRADLTIELINVNISKSRSEINY